MRNMICIMFFYYILLWCVVLSWYAAAAWLARMHNFKGAADALFMAVLFTVMAWRIK